MLHFLPPLIELPGFTVQAEVRTACLVVPFIRLKLGIWS